MTRSMRATAFLLAALAMTYVVACGVYNMPNSPVKVRAVGYARAVIHPWFDQDWQLFAPTPSTSNDRVWLTAQVEEDGQVSTTAPFDIEYPLEGEVTTDHFLPTKAPGITLAMNETWANYRVQLEAISKIPKSVQKVAHGRLDARFATDFDSLDRYLSYAAHSHFPQKHILKVRAKFVRYPMTPFSQRFLAHPPAESAQPQLATDWMPYVSGVGGS